MKEIDLNERYHLIVNTDYRGFKFPKNTKAHYMVMERFLIPPRNPSNTGHVRVLVFDEGTLLERRSDALNYCSHRINEIERRIFAADDGLRISIKGEKAAYKYPDEGWVPIPKNIEEFGEVWVDCTLVITMKDGKQYGIPILSTNPSNFTMFGLVHESYYLRDHV